MCQSAVTQSVREILLLNTLTQNVSVALTAAHKAVLGVLLDGIELFPCCNFKFRACPLRNLTYEVERAFAGCGRREERDVMPR